GRFLADESLRSQYGARAQAVATELTWSEVTKPLLEFCNGPRRAPDLLDPDIVANLPYRLGQVTSSRLLADAVRAGVRRLRTGGLREVGGSATARLRRLRS
ncbi:MAG TPA: hypothetical protein VF711_08900, partial [Acidimicrobiales bacterium]